jgi:transcription elongation GreA/GreB family factor
MPTQSPQRAELMAQHAEARRRRDTAELDGPEYRAACEEIARIEIAIALAEEPPATSPAS